MTVLALLLLAAAPSTPALVADPCAERALDALDHPYPLDSAEEAVSHVDVGDPFMALANDVAGLVSAFTGPGCAIERDETLISIAGSCALSETISSTGRLRVVNAPSGTTIVAESFELRDAASGAVRRYDGWSRAAFSGLQYRHASVGSFDFTGPHSGALAGPSASTNMAFSQERCMVLEPGGRFEQTTRIRIPEQAGSGGTLLVELEGKDTTSLPFRADVRGSSTYHVAGTLAPPGPSCYRVERDGVDLGTVCEAR